MLPSASLRRGAHEERIDRSLIVGFLWFADFVMPGISQHWGPGIP